MQTNNFESIQNFGGTLFAGSSFHGPVNFTNHSNLSPTAEGKADSPWLVPKQSHRLFTGREDVLEEMESSFFPTSTDENVDIQRRFVLAGLGGIGKSEVCLKFAERHREKYWGVLWVDCMNASTIHEAFQRIGTLCGMDKPDFKSVRIWLSNTPKKWLLIFDNADDIKMKYSDYFPSGQRGHMIITTRDPELVHLYGTVGSRLMSTLNLEHAKRLLLLASGLAEDEWSEENGAATKIVNELGQHTLAILHAAAFIRETSCSMDNYITIFRQRQDLLFQHEESREQRAYRSVHITFDVSTRALERMQIEGDVDASNALDLLGILAFMHYEGRFKVTFSRAVTMVAYMSANPYWGDDITGPVLASLYSKLIPEFFPAPDEKGTGDVQWAKACNKLRAFSLLSVQHVGSIQTLTMHPLVHSWNKARQTSLSRHKSWLTTTVVLAHCALPTEHDRHPSNWAMKVHRRAWISNEVEFHARNSSMADVGPLLTQIARHSWYIDDYDTLQKLSDVLAQNSKRNRIDSQCLNSTTLKHSLWSRLTVHTLRRKPNRAHDSDEDINVLYLRSLSEITQGNIANAIAIMEHIVYGGGRETLFWHDSTSYLPYQLAAFYQQNGRAKDAVRLLTSMLKKAEQHPTRFNCSKEVIQRKLGEAYVSNGQLQEAITVLKGAIEPCDQSWDARNIEQIHLRNWLALIYRMDGQMLQAVELGKSTLAMFDQAPLPWQPLKAETQYLLALYYHYNGQFNESIDLLERNIQWAKGFRDEFNYELLKSKTSLGITYFMQGQKARGVEILEDVVAVWRTYGDVQDLDRLMAEKSLANMYVEVGREEEAAVLHEHVDGVMKVKPPSHFMIKPFV